MCVVRSALDDGDGRHDTRLRNNVLVEGFHSPSLYIGSFYSDVLLEYLYPSVEKVVNLHVFKSLSSIIEKVVNLRTSITLIIASR